MTDTQFQKKLKVDGVDTEVTRVLEELRRQG